MRSRSEELRARNRRVFAWSHAIAALVLGGVLFWSPVYHVEPLESPEIERATVDAVATSPLFVHVRFGPPEILATDGSLHEEPADRVLEVGRVVDRPAACAEAHPSDAGPISGRVRLRVDSTGETALVELTESTGSACADRLISVVADALRYHWLPDERFPAPVDLSQPVTLLDVGEAL